MHLAQPGNQEPTATSSHPQHVDSRTYMPATAASIDSTQAARALLCRDGDALPHLHGEKVSPRLGGRRGLTVGEATEGVRSPPSSLNDTHRSPEEGVFFTGLDRHPSRAAID